MLARLKPRRLPASLTTLQRFSLLDDETVEFFLAAPQLLTVLEAVWPVLRLAYPHEPIWLLREPVPWIFYHLPRQVPILQVVPPLPPVAEVDGAGQPTRLLDRETRRLWDIIDASAVTDRLTFFWQHYADPHQEWGVTLIPWLPEDWLGTPYPVAVPRRPSAKAGAA